MSPFTCKVTSENIKSLNENEIFVFGSNKLGVHGAGAAKMATKWGAIRGCSTGFMGSTFAIPTKNHWMDKIGIPIDEIKIFVDNLKDIIPRCPDKFFLITKIGCGYAGYTPKDIAPLFKDFLQISNCSLPIEFISRNIEG